MNTPRNTVAWCSVGWMGSWEAVRTLWPWWFNWRRHLALLKVRLLSRLHNLAGRHPLRRSSLWLYLMGVRHPSLLLHPHLLEPHFFELDQEPFVDRFELVRSGSHLLGVQAERMRYLRPAIRLRDIAITTEPVRD